MEAEKPRLSWWLPEGSTTPKAYRIVTDGLWDSGWVESDQSVNVPYGGKTVKGRNDVLFQTRSGAAGNWPVGFEMPDGCAVL